MGYLITHRLSRSWDGLEYWTVEWLEGDVVFLHVEDTSLAVAHQEARRLYGVYCDAFTEQFSQVDRTQEVT